MHPRLRRITADAQQVTQCFADHPYIDIVRSEGQPPEKYEVHYKVRSMVLDATGKPMPHIGFNAEIFHSLDYPRRPPFCRMLTPVFHPNIDAQKICIGDHWSAGQRLVDLIVRIGEMLCYQSYNTQSPLNAQAAAWSIEHGHELPLQRDDLVQNTI